jgi:hypothetical protein
MTNKITKEFLFTELSIKIATLEMKLDKVLDLLNQPEYEITNVINISDHMQTIPTDEEFLELINEKHYEFLV